MKAVEQTPRRPHPSGGLASSAAKTSLLALLPAVAFASCARGADSPPAPDALDAPATSDAQKAEAGPDADRTPDAAQDVVDAPTLDADSAADVSEGATDGSDDSGATDAGQSACNQPGDAAADARRAYYDLVVDGRWNGADGRRIFVLTREFDTMIPRGYGSAVIKDGTFLIRLSRAYLSFSYQPVFYFLDVDDDGRCDPTIDRAFRGVTSACQMRDCEATAYENPPGPSSGTEICNIMNACR